MRSKLLALAVLVLGTSALWADMGPPRTVRIKLDFENLADYPGYDFYLEYGLGHGDPAASPHLARVAPEAVVSLEGAGRFSGVSLIAVPHGQAEPPLPKSEHDQEYQEWLKSLPAGTLHAPLKGIENDYKFTYRVAIDGDHLSAVQTASHLSQSDWFLANLCLIVPAIAISAFCALIVLWLISWRRRRERTKEGPVREDMRTQLDS